VVLCLRVVFLVAQITPLCYTCMGEFSHGNPENPSSKAAQGPLHREVETMRLALVVEPAGPCFAGARRVAGGAVNRDDVPDGGIHLSSETHVGRVRDRKPRRGGEQQARRIPTRTTLCTFPVPVFSLCSVRDCASGSYHQSSEISAFLNLEVEYNACQCTCFRMSNQIAAFARLHLPTQAARYARARLSISRIVPARAKVANVSNWMRFWTPNAT